MPWWGWALLGAAAVLTLWALLRRRGPEPDRAALADAERRRREEEVTAVTERDAALAKTELNLRTEMDRAATDATKRKEESDEKAKLDAGRLAAPGSDLLDRADRLAGKRGPGSR